MGGRWSPWHDSHPYSPPLEWSRDTIRGLSNSMMFQFVWSETASCSQSDQELDEDQFGPYIELCFDEDMAKVILTEEQLQEVNGVGPSLAKNIKDALS